MHHSATMVDWEIIRYSTTMVDWEMICYSTVLQWFVSELKSTSYGMGAK